MPSHLDHLEYLVGGVETIQRMANLPALPPFSPAAVDFLAELSKRLMGGAEAKAYPDVVAFGFWCRKASVEEMRKPYGALPNRLGRGMAFHVAPANVPVNFAYSLAVGLLAGNANVVRVPSKNFPQVGLICGAIREVLAFVPDMAGRICLVKYGHEKAVTDALSARCDARIIWGGDDTIRTIRESPLPPRAVEITFADRYSFAVIDADGYLKLDPARVAQDFYNDTYLTDQNACTSPQLVAWRGHAVAEAQTRFWAALHARVAGRYELPAVAAVGKRAAACRLAAALDGRLAAAPDNLITRIAVSRPSPELVDFKYHSGFFAECVVATWDEVLPLCDPRCQTIACIGVPPGEIAECLVPHAPRGVDRIVSVGQTMDFALVWDGHDLIRELSRTVVVMERSGVVKS